MTIHIKHVGRKKRHKVMSFHDDESQMDGLIHLQHWDTVQNDKTDCRTELTLTGVSPGMIITVEGVRMRVVDFTLSSGEKIRRLVGDVWIA